MQIEERNVGDVKVLDLKGKITLGEGDELLKDKVNSLVNQGSKKIVLSRRAGQEESVDAMLQEAKARVSGPQVLTAEGKPQAEEPVPLDPEAVRVLETQLLKRGDVSTILEERDRFSVYRLLKPTAATWTVEAAVFPKRDFGSWLESVARPGRGPD